jgi:hypothetical protein
MKWGFPHNWSGRLKREKRSLIISPRLESRSLGRLACRIWVSCLGSQSNIHLLLYYRIVLPFGFYFTQIRLTQTKSLWCYIVVSTFCTRNFIPNSGYRLIIRSHAQFKRPSCLSYLDNLITESVMKELLSCPKSSGRRYDGTADRESTQLCRDETQAASSLVMASCFHHKRKCNFCSNEGRTERVEGNIRTGGGSWISKNIRPADYFISAYKIKLASL